METKNGEPIEVGQELIWHKNGEGEIRVEVTDLKNKKVGVSPVGEDYERVTYPYKLELTGELDTDTEYELSEVRLRVAENPHDRDLSNPDKVAELAREILRKKSDGKEHFIALHLNGKNELMNVDHVSMGSLTSSIVHPRETFRPAVASGAAAVIFFHNHPSGDASPSKEDIQITERLVEAGEILGIEVLDHLVIGDGEYRSFDNLDLM